VLWSGREPGPKQRGAQSKVTWPLGKRRLNVYSLCRSGNPPPAPQSGSEIRRSICSAVGALRGAIGVFGNRYLCNPTSTNGTGNDHTSRAFDGCGPGSYRRSASAVIDGATATSSIR
jgi:hypothetical protein